MTIFILDNGQDYSDHAMAFVRSDDSEAFKLTLAAASTYGWSIVGETAHINWRDNDETRDEIAFFEYLHWFGQIDQKTKQASVHPGWWNIPQHYRTRLLDSWRQQKAMWESWQPLAVALQGPTCGNLETGSQYDSPGPCELPPGHEGPHQFTARWERR